MFLHEKPIVTQLRGYKDNPEGYSEKAPYDLIVTIQYLGDDTVYLEGMSGSFDRDTLKALIDYAKTKGVKFIKYKRNTTSSKDVTIEVS